MNTLFSYTGETPANQQKISREGRRPNIEQKARIRKEKTAAAAGLLSTTGWFPAEAAAPALAFPGNHGGLN